MITKDNDPKSASASGEQNEIAHTDANISHSKRKLAKAGLAASGVMLTLASKSVLAGRKDGTGTGLTPFQCTSPSGFSSLNVSAPGKNQNLCLGRTPGYWAQWPEDWANCSPAYDPGVCTDANSSGKCLTFDPNTGTPFHAGVMSRSYPTGFSGFSGTTFGDMSLMGVIVDNSALDKNNVARHVAATVLNIAHNWIPSDVMTMTTLLGIWDEYLSSGGYYKPTAGVTWNGQQIVCYLLSLTDGPCAI